MTTFFGFGKVFLTVADPQVGMQVRCNARHTEQC